MSIVFSDICKVAGANDLTFSQNPGKVLLGFWPTTRKLSSDYLYALKASELPNYEHLDNCNLLIYADIPLAPEYYHIVSLNFIVTQSAKDFEELQYQVQKVFDNQAKINNYAYSLLTICQNEGNVQKLLDICYNHVLNPILFLDASWCLHEHSGAFSGMQESTIQFCLKEKRMPPAFLHEIPNGSLHYQDPVYSELLLIDPGIKELSDSQTVLCRVLRHNKILGYLVMFAYNHSITNINKEYLIILSDFVAIAANNKLLPDNNIYSQIEDFLTSILSKRLTDENAIEQRCIAYHLNTADSYTVCSVKSSFSEIAKDKLSYLKRQIRRVFSHCTPVFFNGLLILVVETEALYQFQDTLLQFLTNNDCICMISISFHSYTKLLKAYQQTLACMDMHMAFRLKDTIMYYEDWKLTHMLLQCQSTCDLEDMIHKDVRILREWDLQKGSDLTQTLFAYLHHRQDITATAKELHLHYNTLKYRIQKIQELTNIDFNDYKYMFQIIMAEKALHLMDLLKHQTDQPV